MDTFALGRSIFTEAGVVALILFVGIVTVLKFMNTLWERHTKTMDEHIQKYEKLIEGMNTTLRSTADAIHKMTSLLEILVDRKLR